MKYTITIKAEVEAKDIREAEIKIEAISEIIKGERIKVEMTDIQKI